MRQETDESGEQGSESSCGAAGGKGLNQGEFARPKHVPDAGPGERVTGGRADTASCNEKAQEKLTALLHHITTDALRCAFYDLKKIASAGVDGLVWTRYEDGLEERLLDLHGRVHSGAYRALPSRRVEIPKPDGGTRPLGIAALGQDCPKGSSG